MRLALNALLCLLVCALNLACKQREATSESLSTTSSGKSTVKTKLVKFEALGGALDLADKFMKENHTSGCTFSQKEGASGSLILMAIDRTAEVATLEVNRTSLITLTQKKGPGKSWELNYQVAPNRFFNLVHGVIVNNVESDLITVANGNDKVTCTARKSSMWDLLDDDM